MSVAIATFQKGDEVIADINREGRIMTLPGIVRGCFEDQVYVVFPSRLVPAPGRKFNQRHTKWTPDWEWLPADRVYRDPYAKAG